MTEQTRLNGACRRDLKPIVKPLAYACMTAMGLSHLPALAQETSGPVEEVTVTGSRIQTTSGMNTPTPVTVVTSEELSYMAPGNIIEALSQLPLFYNNTSPADPGGFFTSPGSGNLNLRGIGTRRTLVLLDGRRVVSSTRFGGTDVNVFPEALIRSVETVTGGASAAYGTDAVTGVTNFILDTEFEGFTGHAQTGSTSEGDNDNWEASFAGGMAIGDRMHLLFSTDHYEQDGVFSYQDRDWYQAWGTVLNTDPNGPTELIRPQVVSTSATFDGLITAPGTPLHGLNFNSAGTAATPFIFDSSNRGFRQTIAGNNGSGDLIGADRPTVQSDFERDSTFLYFDFDVNDRLKFFAQGIRGQSITTQNNLSGQFQFVFSPMVIFSGNAFLPASIQQIMDDNNIASFNLNRMGHSSDLATGGAASIQDSTMESTTIGFEAELDGGGFFDGWRLEGYYQDGESDTKARQRGGIRLDRIHMAHDAVVDPNGNIVCNVTLVSGLNPDCVPLNPFGRGNMSQAAIDWVTGFDEGNLIETPLYYTQSGFDLGLTDSYISESDKVVSSKIEQEVFDIVIGGDILDNRNAGPISIAFGGGYREEKMNQIMRSPVLPTGNLDTGRPVPGNDAALGIRGQPGGDVNNSVAIQYSKVPNIRGKMDVSEVFGEVLVPLIAGNKLNLPVAARYADYSGSGGVWAWKAGLDSQVTDSLRLRATRSHDVRAGTLSERFDQVGSAGSVSDPFNNNAQVSIFQAAGGDPNIRPEEADTITAGVIWQPSGASGLSLSADWFEVDLVDAIQSLSSQQTLDQCFAGDLTLCGRVFRLPDGTINLIQATNLNVAKANVSGVDFEVSYRRDIDWFGGGEVLTFRALSTHLIENSTQNFQAPLIDRAGQTAFGFDYPTDKFTANARYSRGPFTAFLQVRWIDEGIRDVLEVEGVDIDDNSIDSVTYTDLNIRYLMQTSYGDWEFFGVVNNLLDEDPPVVANFGLFGANATQTNSGLYDVLGRRYTFGANFSF